MKRNNQSLKLFLLVYRSNAHKIWFQMTSQFADVDEKCKPRFEEQDWNGHRLPSNILNGARWRAIESKVPALT